ncbi:carboxymuconolactone decarboxylase family protein [Microlunatus parietis]|uniref:AhpD family alkylhydroperoxidase n=1 Tax=Microlunatus parietis TaxID=682979 RepID=A0A7Y9I4P5_9ACTN|nr:carboxymuconolactone decarboxylase family protein [Microlunatus parietis]NYE70222.1 AhpD family alkylhydroperoxidase [Microlunatus parietis]
MEARMKNPGFAVPGAMEGIQKLVKAIHSTGTDNELLELIALRASQINGCSACVYGHVANLKKAGVGDDRVGNIGAWREAPFYSDAERAALQLAESMTRQADKSSEVVPDEVWDAVTDHFDEGQLSAIILTVALTNMFNRINATIQEPAGQTW